MKMTPLAVLAALAAHGVSVAHAATITADSCSGADVQAAIDLAEDGDSVVIPEGECTWSEPVSIGEVTGWNPTTYASKSITLAGASADRTILRIDMDSSDDALSVAAEAGKPFRITSLTFRGARNQGRCQRAIVVGGDAEDWRVDHVTFDYADVAGAAAGCGIGASGRGVIDHCRFYNVYTAIAAFGDGDASWERPLQLGSAEAVYIEDNVIHNTEIVGDGATDAYGGARYVFRHNQVTNARAGHHGLDSGGYRSPHSFEIYNNTFAWTVSNTWYTWRSRGGTGVIFGNTITGAGNPSATFGVVNYRTCCCHLCTNVDPNEYGSSCDPFVACADPLHTNCGSWGRCDGSSPIDGNTPGMMGYPCMDQTGRSTDMDGDGIQDLEPLYEWDNTVDGTNANVTVNDPWGCDSPSMADHIQEGRDFFNDTPRPGYAPYAYPHPLTGDGGSSGGAGGGGTGGGTADGGSDDGAARIASPDDASGCACTIDTRDGAASALAAALAGCLFWVLRRRRPPRPSRPTDRR